MKISQSLLTSTRLFRWLKAGSVVLALALTLAGGLTFIWLMKNVMADNETRQIADHLRAELWTRLVPEDLQPPLSPKAVAALEHISRHSSLARTQDFRILRLWSAEGKFLWSSQPDAGAGPPPPEAFREALQQGFAFRQIPVNSLLSGLWVGPAPLYLDTWVSVMGTDAESSSGHFRFVIGVRSEPSNLQAEVAAYKIRIWLISGVLGLVALAFILMGLYSLKRLHAAAARQAARGALTGNITRALSANMDPDLLFRSILYEIRQVVPCDRIAIGGVDPSTREHHVWHVEFSIPVPLPPPETARKSGEWYLEHVYSPMRPANFPDLETLDAPWVDRFLKAGIKSYFVLPVRRDEGEDRYFVHLGLSWTRKGGVDAEGQELLSSLAPHIGSAIRNAILFQKAERRASRLATLNTLSHKVAQSIDLKETLESIVHAAVELLGANIARVLLLDEETGALIPQAHAGHIPPPAATPGTMRLGRGVIGRVVETGEACIFPDVQEVSEWQLTDWVREHNLHAYIVHPLRLGGKPFGAIYCLSSKEDFFTREDLELLGLFSFQASIAIEKARILAETRRRAVQLEVAGEISKALASTLQPDELFRTIVREIRRAISCERCVIGSFDRETRLIHPWHFESEVDLPMRSDPFEEEKGWWDRDIYELKRPVIFSDISDLSHPRAQSLLSAGLKSLMVTPIVRDDVCTAHILLASTRPANFTREHARLLLSLSDHLGMAIRNAMLYQASADKGSQLEVVGEIARAVSSSLEPGEIFETIIREIRRAVPCGRCVLASLNRETGSFHYWHTSTDVAVKDAPADDVLSRWLIENVYEPNRPLQVPDNLLSPSAHGRRVGAAGLRSTLFIPISQEGYCAAHLALSRPLPNAFSREEERLLTSIAAHIGPAIRNAMLFQASGEKTSRLELAGEIAKAVSSSLEPEEIFRTITQEIRRAVPCERCVIATLDSKTATTDYWHIDTGVEMEPPAPGQREEIVEFLLDAVYRRKEPCYLPDIARQRGTNDRLGRAGLRSALFVPILDRGECIAHISLSRTRTHAFTRSQQELLASIAAYVGPAIRNAKLYRTAGERASRLAILNEVNREISESLEAGEVLKSISEAATTLLHADYARIFMLDPETRNLTLRAAVGKLPWPRERTAIIPPQSSLASWVLENEQAALVTDLRSDSRWNPMPWEWIPRGSVQSAVCHPLTEGGRPIGVILGLSERKAAFTPEDLALLGALASQASIAIEKALHFEKARERAARLTVLNQLNQKIIATHSLNEILNALIQASAQLLKGEHVHIFLFDEASNRLALEACYGGTPTKDGKTLSFRPGEGVGGRVFETGVPVNLPDVLQEPNWLSPDWVQNWGVHSFICQPLTLRGRNIGLINCFSSKKGFFTEEDVSLLGALASQAAIAIEKTSLLDQARERAARLELTGEITRAMNSSLEPDLIFRIIVSEIRRAVPCDRCVVSSVDPATKAYHYYHVDSDLSVSSATPEGSLASGSWFHREVYQTMQPKFVPDLAEIREKEVTLWAGRLLKAGLRSLLIIPVLQDGRCIAHLSLTSSRVNAFSQNQIDLLASIAQHIGSAIRNASLYRTAEQRASRLLVLNRLNRHITENLSLDDTLGNIVHSAYDLLNGDHSRLFLIDETTNRLVLRAFYGNVPDPQNTDLSFLLGEGVLGHVGATGEPALVGDVQANPRWRTQDWAHENDVHSYIAQPLRQGGKIIGVLNCLSRKHDFFSPPDLELLGALASQAAIAVQNARLHDEEKRSREFLNSVVGDTSDPIVITGLDRTVLLWNSGAETLYGYSESEALGRKVTFIIPEEDGERNREILGRVFAEVAPATYETHRRHKDGTLIPVSITLSPVQDERGEVVALAGIHKDLTERKRAERAMQEAKEEAEAANRAKSAFLSNLNHELRSPLNVITGLSDILRLQARDAEIGRAAQRIREAGEHMLRLIEDLLDLDRIATGKLGLQLQDVSIDSLVRATLEVRRHHLPEGFTLESDFQAGDCQVRCDPTRTQQILLNLLDNAVKYSPSGGTIRVRTEQRGGEAWVSVEDQGIGVGPEEADLIFQRFAQLESGGAHRGGGLGIGLHLVQQFLALQGGRVWVKGEKGVGSTFTFALPGSPRAAPRTEAGNGEGALPAAEAEEPWEGASVLVLEGRTPLYGYLKMLMRSAGRLLSARTAEEGLAAIRRDRPDLILMDLEAPREKRLQLLQRLKSLPEARGIPTVAVSAEAPGEEKDICRKLGIEGFVSKPIDPVAFRLEIGRVLSARGKKAARPPLPARQN